MNKLFTFVVAVYSASPALKYETTEIFQASGSQETRARRRLIDQLHKRGWCVRWIELVESQPCPKGM